MQTVLLWNVLIQEAGTEHYESDEEYFSPPEKENELTENERDTCEGRLTEYGCIQTMKAMENGKSPAEDGFPVKFYKIIRQDIAKLNMNALNTAYKSGKLSITQRRGKIKF